MEKLLKIYPSEMNADQGLELHNVLGVSRAIFSADGRRKLKDSDSSDKLSELVTSAPGGSYKRALKESLEPGNPPLLIPYDRAMATIPGFKLASVNLEMSYRAIDRHVAKDGRHGEILILDKKTSYYETVIRHQVNREDPEQPLESDHSVPLEELLAPYESRVTELFTYSDNPAVPIEHTLGISSNWYRPLGELNVDDSLNRLSLHIGYILRPEVVTNTETPSRTNLDIPHSLSA